jgi:pSer/pThr/pTyr-binding forkhead associated (FHA) protein
MPGYLVVGSSSGPQMVALEGDRLTIGRGPSNDLPLEADTKVSRLHAVLERYQSGWAIRDLGSRNGTYVNGERLLAERVLRPGDEVTIGDTRLAYRLDEATDASLGATRVAEGPPELTRREREVLVALCRPVFSSDMFTEPASVKDIAQQLFVTEAAVKQHLAHLYDKFAVYGDTGRRTRLANEAIRRGAVRLADLRAAGEPESTS